MAGIAMRCAYQAPSAPGSTRTLPFLCAEPAQTFNAGCVKPEDCADGMVCECLSGRCRPWTDEDCAVDREGPRGERAAGDLCQIVTERDVPSCATIGAADFCGDGLACAPAGPTGWGPLCGYPKRKSGVCRTSCDVRSPSCPTGEACFVVEGVRGGVCLPRDYIAERNGACGVGLCAPGETCVLSGTLYGAAHGACQPVCELHPGGCAHGTRQPFRWTQRFTDVGVCAEVTSPGELERLRAEAISFFCIATRLVIAAG